MSSLQITGYGPKKRPKLWTACLIQVQHHQALFLVNRGQHGQAVIAFKKKAEQADSLRPDAEKYLYKSRATP